MVVGITVFASFFHYLNFQFTELAHYISTPMTWKYTC